MSRKTPKSPQPNPNLETHLNRLINEAVSPPKRLQLTQQTIKLIKMTRHPNFKKNSKKQIPATGQKPLNQKPKHNQSQHSTLKPLC